MFIQLGLIVTSLLFDKSIGTPITIIRLETAQVAIFYCLDVCLCLIILTFCGKNSQKQLFRDSATGRIYLIISTKFKKEDKAKTVAKLAAPEESYFEDSITLNEILERGIS